MQFWNNKRVLVTAGASSGNIFWRMLGLHRTTSWSYQTHYKRAAATELNRLQTEAVDHLPCVRWLAN
jgi:hypothetical protein